MPRSKRGASSILVMFMMIILVVLGALAFTASYANLRLSKRTQAAYADMYKLDAAAEGVVARVDAQLNQAGSMATDYMERGSFNLQVGGDLDLSAQSAIYNAYRATAFDVTARRTFLEKLYRSLYFYYAYTNLEPLAKSGDIGLKLSDAYPNAQAMLLPATPPPEEGVLVVTINESFGSDPGERQLSGELTVVLPAYTVTPEPDFAKVGSGGDTSRMRFTAWRHWQVPFNYDDGLNFDSVIVNNEDK